MPGWTLVDTHPIQGRTFQRPLDATDLRYIWMGLLNGAGDGMQHVELRLTNSPQDAYLFSTDNIVRAWLSTKRRYPLVAASVQKYSASARLDGAANSKAEGGDGNGGDNGIGLTSGHQFVVREHDLSVLRPGEVEFEEATSAEEVQQRVAAIFNGPRALSDNLLMKLFIFRETDSKRTDVIHLITLVAHCITDGMARETLIRYFLDTLARGDSNSEPAQVPLEDRLAMAHPLMDLEPTHLRSLSPVVRRWRRAAGAVICQLRWAKLQGGYTLPRRVTGMTPLEPARSGRVLVSLTAAQSSAVFANCRLYGFTFGNAYLVLAQVAMTRVLYRCYLRGEISEEEWTYRKTQPYINMGPVNLRPYLDKAWFDRGGRDEIMPRVAAIFYQLPFMTPVARVERHQHHEHDSGRSISDGAPPFPDILTFDRFLHRAGLATKQAKAFFTHPLFFEIIYAASQVHAERGRLAALQWMKCAKAGGDNGMHGNKEQVLSVTNTPLVIAHGGSSLGNVDLISPSEYPLPPSHPFSPYSSVTLPCKVGHISPSPSPSTSEVDATPKIVVEHSRRYVRSRPSELYLGAYTRCGELSMFVYYDGNAFEDKTVNEWLDEVMEATLWYLGRIHARPVIRAG